MNRETILSTLIEAAKKLTAEYAHLYSHEYARGQAELIVAVCGIPFVDEAIEAVYAAIKGVVPVADAVERVS